MSGSNPIGPDDPGWTEKHDQILAKVLAKVKDDPNFSDEDLKALKEVVSAWNGWKSFGRFSKWVVYLLAALAGAITAYNSILAQVRQWLTGN
jgi:hypothetical protein